MTKIFCDLARAMTAAAADMDTEFARERRESAFERADHARGDPRGMPVHITAPKD
jgi:hypothetical protein